MLLAGLNTGVMLVRNTDWSRALLDQTAHFGQFPPNMTTEQVGSGPHCDVRALHSTSSPQACQPAVSRLDEQLPVCLPAAHSPCSMPLRAAAVLCRC